MGIWAVLIPYFNEEALHDDQKAGVWFAVTTARII
jgi:hypothetical protein